MRLACWVFAAFANPCSNRYLLYSDPQRIGGFSWSYTFFESLAVDLACVFDGEFYSLGTNIFG